MFQDKESIWWLVFIQILLSPYSRHHSKLSDLLKNLVCSESKCNDTATLFEYYMTMCKDVMALYVYLSPKEVNGKCNKMILQRSKKEIMFAVTAKGSDTAKVVEVAANI